MICRLVFFITGLLWTSVSLAVSSQMVISLEKTGISMYNDLKYAAHFAHFDYVNPNAPKGGILRQAALGSFDTFNPFVMDGIAPGGIFLTHDTLMKQSDDEPFSLYGLIADKVAVAPDYSWVSFHLNENARFNDGTVITPEDIVFSFEILKEKGLPAFRYYYNDVRSVEKLDNQRVIFYLNSDKMNRELPLILGELPVLSEAFWKKRDFTATSLDIPVSSGPYKIVSFDAGRRIVYRLNPDYWAKELNVNKGFYNFEEIRYDYYRDSTVALEAFKAGLIDVRLENEAKRWFMFQKWPDVKKGYIHMRSFEHHLPSGMQGFVFNLRRPIFQDIRVRQALSLVFDFGWANTNLFYNLYQRTTSYFDNSNLKAPPLPDEAELSLLNPLKKDLPPEVFNKVYQPTDPQASVRDNLKQALQLLESAGWHISDGILKNEMGQPFEFEILLDAVSSSAWERVALPFVGRLKRLGINARLRVVDLIQYKNRLDAFDYDMIVTVWGQSLSPGNEQRYFWGSDAAISKGSLNYAGISNPAIDTLIEQVVHASDRKQLETAVHALDRVLLWSYLVIPHWYSPVQRYVFWDKFDMPERPPLKGTNILYWWMKPTPSLQKKE